MRDILHHTQASLLPYRTSFALNVLADTCCSPLFIRNTPHHMQALSRTDTTGEGEQGKQENVRVSLEGVAQLGQLLCRMMLFPIFRSNNEYLHVCASDCVSLLCCMIPVLQTTSCAFWALTGMSLLPDANPPPTPPPPPPSPAAPPTRTNTTTHSHISHISPMYSGRRSSVLLCESGCPTTADERCVRPRSLFSCPMYRYSLSEARGLDTNVLLPTFYRRFREEGGGGG